MAASCMKWGSMVEALTSPPLSPTQTHKLTHTLWPIWGIKLSFISMTHKSSELRTKSVAIATRRNADLIQTYSHQPKLDFLTLFLRLYVSQMHCNEWIQWKLHTFELKNFLFPWKISLLLRKIFLLARKIFLLPRNIFLVKLSRLLLKQRAQTNKQLNYQGDELNGRTISLWAKSLRSFSSLNLKCALHLCV